MENNAIRGSTHCNEERNVVALNKVYESGNAAIGLNSTSMSSDGQMVILFIFFGHLIVTELLIMQNNYV